MRKFFVLNGFFAEAFPVYERSNLTPVLGSLQELASWKALDAGRTEKLPYALHVDTGMNRLGLTVNEAIRFAGESKDERADPAHYPSGNGR